MNDPLKKRSKPARCILQACRLLQVETEDGEELDEVLVDAIKLAAKPPRDTYTPFVGRWWHKAKSLTDYSKDIECALRTILHWFRMDLRVRELDVTDLPSSNQKREREDIAATKRFLRELLSDGILDETEDQEKDDVSLDQQETGRRLASCKHELTDGVEPSEQSSLRKLAITVFLEEQALALPNLKTKVADLSDAVIRVTQFYDCVAAYRTLKAFYDTPGNKTVTEQQKKQQKTVGRIRRTQVAALEKLIRKLEGLESGHFEQQSLITKSLKDAAKELSVSLKEDGQVVNIGARASGHWLVGPRGKPGSGRSRFPRLETE